MARRQRLDLELVRRGLADSRQQAQQLIRAGKVRGGDRVLDKPGTEVAPELELQVEAPPRFVSRGGDKLVAALEALPIRVEGRVCLDGGISTGGFSDCLLQHGARRVYGIDVGYGQTAWSLRTDPRVVLRERTNLRHLQPQDLYGPGDPWPDLAVADVSFISLAQVLPALRGLLSPPPAGPLAGPARRGQAGCEAGPNAGSVPESSWQPEGSARDSQPQGEPVPGPEAVLLVKPQFEVGRERVGKGGVVRDPRAQRDAILSVIAAARSLGWAAAGLVASPITGPAGNHEYLLWLREPSPAAAESPTQGQERSSAGADGAGPMVLRASADAPLDERQVTALVQHTLAGGA